MGSERQYVGGKTADPWIRLGLCVCLAAMGALSLLLMGMPRAEAHSGGTDANGCHAGSQPYHCHGGGSSPTRPSVGTSICNDGAVSGSTGPGTCSHHGGVRGGNPSLNYGSSSSGDGGGVGRIQSGRVPLTSRSPGWWQRNEGNVMSALFWGGAGGLMLRFGVGRRAARPSQGARPTVQSPPMTGIAPPLEAAPRSRLPSDVPDDSAASTKGKPRSPVQQDRPGRAVGRCRCGGTMVVRRNGATGVLFAGCSRYPGCFRTNSLSRS